MTHYIKIEDGIKTLTSKPRWFNDAGEQLSDEELLDHNYFAVVYDTPSYDETKQRIQQNDINDWGFEAGKFYATYTITDIPFEAFKANKLAEINSNSQREVGVYMQPYPQFEVATWDIQKAEAEAYLIDDTQPTPFCDVAALYRDIDRVDFIQRVKEKSDLFVQVSAMIAGYRQRLEDRVMAIDPESPSAIDDVIAITWESPLNGLT